MPFVSTTGWAVMWRQRNKLDGDVCRLQWFGCPPRLPIFPTKREAEQFIEREYGFIMERKDLRDEPHGWRMPRAVRVVINT